MSTYYRFVCPECDKLGGFLTRQAWGTGNFDIIETFKFLGIHKDHKPFLIDEHSKEYEETPEHTREDFVEKSHDMMPHSNDWALVSDNEWPEVEKKWEEEWLKKHDYTNPLENT